METKSLNTLTFRGKMLEAFHQCKKPYSETPIVAAVDMHNDIDNRCVITDVIYDETTNTIIIAVDATDLEY